MGFQGLRELPTWQKWAGGITGTFVLGVVSNGVWQRLGDPLYVFLRDAALNLTTLGLASLKDALYAESREVCMKSLVVCCFFVSFVTVTMGLAPLATGPTRLRRVDLSTLRKIHTLREEGKTRQEVRAALARPYKVLLAVLLPIYCVFAFSLMFLGCGMFYTSRAIAYYYQLVVIVEPHIPDATIKQFHSRFAQIDSASSYTALTNDLLIIARQHQLKTPQFSIW